MKKRTPHCKLAVVKELAATGSVEFTRAARVGAAELNLDTNDVLETVLVLTMSDFYKSMTTHSDHRIWQDVCRPKTGPHTVYLKLTVMDNLLIVSFKEL